MRIRSADRTLVDARAIAEAAADVVTDDYYAQLAQIRLTRDPSDHRGRSSGPMDVVLDGTDVARLVECAVRHPNFNMQNAVAAAIWNHPEMFRQIFEFGLNAPEAFLEIREVVANALAKHRPASETRAAGREKALLPRMPLPAHLRDRTK
jgi:hypothetical protein